MQEEEVEEVKYFRIEELEKLDEDIDKGPTIGATKRFIEWLRNNESLIMEIENMGRIEVDTDKDKENFMKDLVELYVPRPGEQRGVAHRLFRGVTAHPGQNRRSRHPLRGHRQRPLPGDPGTGPVVKHQTEREGTCLPSPFFLWRSDMLPGQRLGHLVLGTGAGLLPHHGAGSILGIGLNA